MDGYVPRRRTSHKQKPEIDHSNEQQQQESNSNAFTRTGGLDWLEDINVNRKASSSNQQEQEITSSTLVKDLEEKLSKEKLKSSRLQSDINRLTTELKASRLTSSNQDGVTQYIPQINFNDLHLGEKIGQGGFSEIQRAKWLNLDVAVKIIFDPKITEQLKEEFNNEINKLFKVRHPNIINLLGVCTKNSKLAIVMELADKGSLFDYLHKNPQNKDIPLSFKYKVIQQLIRTMLYLHEMGYVHRDLKTQNILLDNNHNIKLCDFGLTKSMCELNIGSGQFAGTITYMAPELFNRKAYDEKVDVFAFGTIVWEVFNRKVPYFGCEQHEIKNKLMNGEQLPITKGMPVKIGEIVNKCRNIDASKRPSFKELANMNLE